MTASSPRTERQREAVALHENGHPTGEIAAQMGVTYARAREILVRLGIAPHRAPNRWPRRMSRSRQSIEDHNAARRSVVVARRAQIAEWLDADPTLTSAEISKRCGLSIPTILVDRRAIGSPAPKPGA
jgi:DNA-binding CsgD family transcriptional regulator